MAEKVTVPKTANRYGPRYGARNRKKLEIVEAQYKNGQKCPYCLKQSVTRDGPGIFSCTKCNTKFTGRSYSIESSAKFITDDEEKQ